MAARQAKFLPQIFEYYFNNVNPNRSHLLYNKNTVVVIVLFIDIDFFVVFSLYYSNYEIALASTIFNEILPFMMKMLWRLYDIYDDI